jgi:F420-dependent oxidoreductase-like protein
MAWRRERLEFDGAAVRLPLPPAEGTGLGRPLKLVNQLVRDRIPIWWASLMGKSVAATAELADGWLPTFFIPDRAEQVWGEQLRAGLALRSHALGPLQIAAAAPVAIGEDLPVAELRDRGRAQIALYVGGMGARGKNFYNTIAQLYGFEAEAAQIQDLYLAGKKDEAAAMVPDEWLRLSSLIGPRSHVAERLAAYREAGVTVLTLEPLLGNARETIEQMRELVD